MCHNKNTKKIYFSTENFAHIVCYLLNSKRIIIQMYQINPYVISVILLHCGLLRLQLKLNNIALMPFLFKARLSHINQTDIRYVFYLLKLNNTRIRFLSTEIKYHMNTCKYLLSICGLPYRYLKRTLRTILICFANKKKCSYSSLMSSKDI